MLADNKSPESIRDWRCSTENTFMSNRWKEQQKEMVVMSKVLMEA
jgi:hypothetical protein